MRHWSQLATRNWRVKRIRTLGALLAITLGTGAVVWVTCCYESVRRTVLEWAGLYVGSNHVTIDSPLGKYAQISQRLVESLEPLEGVRYVTARLIQRLNAVPLPRADRSDPSPSTRQPDETTPEVEFCGVQAGNPELDHRYPVKLGRMLTAEDGLACVAEGSFAREHGAGIGDVLLVWGGAREEPFELEIVGLMELRRIEKFQKSLCLLPLPVLQQINIKLGLVTSVEVSLEDGSPEGVRRAAPLILAAVRRIEPKANVRSAEARMRQIEKAQSQQEFVLVLLSCVAMLTALFIILSTLSMGMIERIGQLGLLRCIGTTGGQLSQLVIYEVLPLGVLGIILGVPTGLGLAALSVRLVPEYVGSFAVSWDGLWQAAVAGLATTLVAALLPALAALTVSPLDAAHPRARPARRLTVLVALLAAALALALQHLKVYRLESVPFYVAELLDEFRVERTPQFVENASSAIVLLYVAYALAAPALVWVIGSPAVWLVAALVGVRLRLLQDQVGHAVWRSAGICCGLMVGLSLIVGLVVLSESFKSSWQFPRQFPEAYVWNPEQMRADAAEIVRSVPGVGEFTTANALNVLVDEKPLFMESVVRSVTWFIAADPDSIFNLIRLEFLEGDERSARRQLEQGSYVLVADDFARSRNKHLGDSVRVYFAQQPQTFKIAGVVRSPALDIAAGYFQAQTEFNLVAAGSVMGTNADLKRLLDVHGVKLILLNFDLPPEPVPGGWPPARGSGRAAAGLPSYCLDESRPLESRWQKFRQDRVLSEIRQRLGAPLAFAGTAQDLKEEIDNQLSRMTRLLSAVPAVALLVAAIGVANLMTANVASRARQLAILRAVGATRGMVLRLVIGEALVLGVLGSALGVALGVHLALNTTTMIDRMWGLQLTIDMPWGYVGASIVLSVGLCTLAGILPARHAARTNIVEALHVA